MESDLLALHWMEHASVFSQAIRNLRIKGAYTDATLACDGNFYPVHKFVLSTCSQYFSAIFEWTPCINPVVVLNNVTCKELEALIDFMYIGEVSVKESSIPDVMRAAEFLRIRGLSIVDDENTRPPFKNKNKSDIGGPPRKRKRTSARKKPSASGSDNIASSCELSEPNGHLSPPPTSISGHQSSNEGEGNHRDHVPNLTSAHYSQKNSSETDNQDNAPVSPNTLVPNNSPPKFLPPHSSSSVQPEQPAQSLPSPPKCSMNQHSHSSPPHQTVQSYSCALDLSSHEHTSELSVNTEDGVMKSIKLEPEQTKPHVPQDKKVVTSEEIPALLDTLVNMRPFADTKPEPGEEVATLHAVEPSETLYEFTEALPSASAAASAQKETQSPPQKEVQQQKGPSASGSSKKKDQTTSEKKKSVKCPHCDKEFTKKDSLTRHMHIHTKEPYCCDHCSHTTKSYRSLLSHKKKEHGSVHKCTICDFTSHRSESLKHHMKTHEKPHQCSECKFRTSRQENLEKHVKKMHEKK